MTIDHILISTSPGETRTALLSDGRLVKIFYSRTGAESLVGNICLGRVVAVNKGLDAAFVDIGAGDDGFLALPEVRPAGVEGKGAIGDSLNEGASVLVQVTRDAIEEKGPKLTTRMTLAGVNLIFRPRQTGVSVSKRITDDAARERLTQLVAGLTPEDGGFIVRTVAAVADAPVIEAEAARLIAQWREIEQQAGTATPPDLIAAAPAPAVQALRDMGGQGVEAVLTDDAGALAEIKGFCETEIPALASLPALHKGPAALFEAFAVEEQIDAALSPVVNLPGGGSLIISQTPALTAIDVNTGGAGEGSRDRTAHAVNLEAAIEAAHQIRLRNLSGLIVVDFVSVRDDGLKREVVETLRRAVAGDAVPVFVAGTTRLGLVEMTRPRSGPSLRDVLCTPGQGDAVKSPLKSPMTVALTALRAAVRRGGAGVTIKAAPDVIAVMAKTGALKDAERRLGLAIGLDADQNLAADQYEIVDGDGG